MIFFHDKIKLSSIKLQHQLHRTDQSGVRLIIGLIDIKNNLGQEINGQKTIQIDETFRLVPDLSRLKITSYKLDEIVARIYRSNQLFDVSKSF